eukprot:113535-Rhodomonas_salina.2
MPLPHAPALAVLLGRSQPRMKHSTQKTPAGLAFCSSLAFAHLCQRDTAFLNAEAVRVLCSRTRRGAHVRHACSQHSLSPPSFRHCQPAPQPRQHRAPQRQNQQRVQPPPTSSWPPAPA